MGSETALLTLLFKCFGIWQLMFKIRLPWTSFLVHTSLKTTSKKCLPHSHEEFHKHFPSCRSSQFAWWCFYWCLSRVKWTGSGGARFKYEKWVCCAWRSSHTRSERKGAAELWKRSQTATCVTSGSLDRERGRATMKVSLKQCALADFITHAEEYSGKPSIKQQQKPLCYNHVSIVLEACTEGKKGKGKNALSCSSQMPKLPLACKLVEVPTQNLS